MFEKCFGIAFGALVIVGGSNGVAAQDLIKTANRNAVCIGKEGPYPSAPFDCYIGGAKNAEKTTIPEMFVLGYRVTAHMTEDSTGKHYLHMFRE